MNPADARTPFALRAVHAGAPLVFQPLALPPLTGATVRVAVTACALAPRDALEPRVGVAPGSAVTGLVVDGGPEAAHLRGRVVLVPGTLPCGECDACRRGGGALCGRRIRLGVDRDGGLASHIDVPVRFVCEQPQADGGSPASEIALALAAGPALGAYDAVARAGVGPGDVLVVVGGGTEAQVAASIAAERGALVWAIDWSTERLARLAARGARTLLATGRSPEELFGALCAFASEGQVPCAAWRVLETTGSPAGLACVTALAIPALRVVLATPCRERLPLDVAGLCEREAHVVALGVGHPDLVAEVAARAVRGDLALDDLAVPFALDLANEALATLRESRDALQRTPVVRVRTDTAAV